MKKNSKTIIFDLDGVLWSLDFVKFGRMIAKDLHVEECYIEEFANKLPDAIKVYLKKTEEKIDKNVIMSAIDEGIPDLKKYKVNSLMIYAMFINPNYNYSTNNPKALEVVKELYERGYKLVAKSNWFAHVQAVNLRNYGYSPYFEQVVGVLDDYLKPNPRSIAQIFNGKNPENFIIVGDSPEKEIALANEFGMKSIWLNEIGRVMPTENILKPTYEIQDISEILDILL